MSKFDKYYRKSLLSRLFVKGWGNPDLLLNIIHNHRYVSKRETCKNLVTSFNIKTIKKYDNSTSLTIEGSFISPFHSILPDVLDENNRIARFQLLIPKEWKSAYKPLCIHFPGTGDHHYSRRKTFLANRLLKDGIASLIHINPYYGNRKPKDQKGSTLNYLSDLFVMGGALILETQVLLHWAKKEGFGPLAVHGISMGGHMACLGVSVYPEPVCLIPCLSWTTASHVFTEGAISSSVSWDVLSHQYNNDQIFSNEIRAAIEPPIPNHLRNINRLNTMSSKSNTSFLENDKLESQLFKMNMNEPKEQYIVADMGRNSKFHFLKTNFSWTRPLELVSLMRSVTENDKITNEVMETINKQEAIMKQKLISIPVDLETVDFMRDILDFFTHLGNYSVPIDTRLVTVIVAGNDAYVPMDGVCHFYDVWDNRCDIRIREGVGHVEAYLRSSLWTEDRFREGIVETMNRYVELYFNEKGPFGQRK